MAAAPPGMDQATYDRILQEFPAYAYLLAIPEVAALLVEAVDPNTAFDVATFTAKLQQTNWWKTTAETQRQWDAFSATDPATANAQIAQRESDVSAYAAKLGVTLTADQIKYIAITGLRDGVAVGSSLFNQNVVGLAMGPEQAGGDLFAAYSQIQQMANNDYLVGIDQGTAWDWAKQVAAGQLTMDTVKASLQHNALGQFPTLGDLMTKDGVTPGQVLAPAKNAIATTLEISPDQVDFLNDPRFRPVLYSTTNDGTGSRPMNAAEAMTYARGLDAWKNTTAAKQQGADLTATLLQTFGQAKF